MENNLPVNVREYQELAKKALSKMHYDYINGGAEDEHTLRDNIAAYGRILYFPIDLNLIGEVATAKAAASCNSLMVFKKRAVSATLVRRAESSGFKAIVLTVDNPMLGRRERDIRNKMVAPDKPNLEGLISLENLDTFMILRYCMNSFSFLKDSSTNSYISHLQTDGSQLAKYVRDTMDPSLSWKDVEWLKSITSLPILVKGILTAEDARKAVEAGAAGVIVSNHGGRQLDYAPATISVLEEACALGGGNRRAMKGMQTLLPPSKEGSILRPPLQPNFLTPH
uniref:(S)-2-hydroxy-acid oxidase n=1 Tax=Aegilops tauschii TaxID=37682 RepID=R7W2Y8_AEGTA